MNMEGWTMPEMAAILGIDEAAVKMRLWKAGIKPLTTKAVYPAFALDVIRDVPIRGQHRKRLQDEGSADEPSMRESGGEFASSAVKTLDSNNRSKVSYKA
jgi:hypothetical protein